MREQRGQRTCRDLTTGNRHTSLFLSVCGNATPAAVTGWLAGWLGNKWQRALRMSRAPPAPSRFPTRPPSHPYKGNCDVRVCPRGHDTNMNPNRQPSLRRPCTRLRRFALQCGRASDDTGHTGTLTYTETGTAGTRRATALLHVVQIKSYSHGRYVRVLVLRKAVG